MFPPPNLSLVAIAFACAGCYAMRSSSGGGRADFDPPRAVDVRDVAVPDGYRVELVARGLTFPTGFCWNDTGELFVVESGYCYGEVWTTPRLLRVVDVDRVETVAEGDRNGPWNGVDHAGGAFYVAEGGVLEGGRILRIEDGEVERLVEGLPSFGDHHTNGPVVHDGFVYFGQGTATNSGVVGEDNAQFGWLERHPEFCDVPGADIELAGQVFETPDARELESDDRARTSGFAPFGQALASVAGRAACNGSILRVPIGGGPVELVAWGFRNPYGLAFTSDGRLFATDNGYDDRGSRPIWGAADHLWLVEAGAWYGWPDFSGDRPVTEDEFRPPGEPALEFLLAAHPSRPPRPAAVLDVHSAAVGLDFSESERFGHVGDAFIALFGDETPATGKVLAPVGFKVVRVDLEERVVHDFAVNAGEENGPASRLGEEGLERPIDVRFDPTGESLYVLDFGVLLHDERGPLAMPGTGVIWRISRLPSEP